MGLDDYASVEVNADEARLLALVLLARSCWFEVVFWPANGPIEIRFRKSSRSLVDEALASHPKQGEDSQDGDQQRRVVLSVDYVENRIDNSIKVQRVLLNGDPFPKGNVLRAPDVPMSEWTLAVCEDDDGPVEAALSLNLYGRGA